MKSTKFKGIITIMLLLLNCTMCSLIRAKTIKRNAIYDKVRSLMKYDCYSYGDKLNNFICDCYIEQVINNKDPYVFIAKYTKDPEETIQNTTTEYFDVCLSKVVKAKMEGEIE